MNSGSLKAILYIFCQLIDEIMHAFDFLWGNANWRFRFCQWVYRYDWSDQAPDTSHAKREED